MPPRSRSKQPEAMINGDAKAPIRASSRTATKAKVAATKPTSTRAKRAASPESSCTPPPVAKRARNGTTTKSVETNGKSTKPKPSERAASPPPKKAKPVNMAHAKPPLIPIPTLPPKLEPAGQIFVWGTGNFGQFGMGPNLLDEFPKPKKNMWVEEKMGEGLFGPTLGSGIINVAAGGLHSLFIDENGTIWSCGVNDDAALGRVTKDVPDPETPGKVLDVDVLTSVPHPLQTLVDENYKAVRIAAGDSISASISTEGQLRVWGSFRANEGSLGFASGLQHQFLPQAVLDGEQCVSVATGNNHLLVLTAQGLIYSWGAGEQGQLGRKILERRKIHGTVPERVILGNRLRKAVIVGAGNLHSFAVDEEGGVWGWGLNSAGQTGTGIQSSDTDSIVQTPRRVLALGPDKLDGARVIEISGGDLHTLFLTSDGRVFACGRSDSFQLGLPDDHPAFQDREDDSYVAEPVRVPFPDDHDDDPVVHVSAGTRFNAAVTEDGAMYAWGEGSQGEVGVGDVGKAEVPTVVVRREGGSWAAMNASCGGQHSLGLFRRST